MCIRNPFSLSMLSSSVWNNTCIASVRPQFFRSIWIAGTIELANEDLPVPVGPITTTKFPGEIKPFSSSAPVYPKSRVGMPDENL